MKNMLRCSLWVLSTSITWYFSSGQCNKRSTQFFFKPHIYPTFASIKSSLRCFKQNPRESVCVCVFSYDWFTIYATHLLSPLCHPFGRIEKKSFTDAWVFALWFFRSSFYLLVFSRSFFFFFFCVSSYPIHLCIFFCPRLWCQRFGNTL